MGEYYRYRIIERTEPRRYRDTASEYADDVREYVRPTRTELVRRARQDSDLSIEEVQRDFPPGQDYDRPRGRARSYDRGRGYDDDDEYYAAAAVYGRDPRRSEGDVGSIRGGRRPRRDRSRSKSLGRAAELAAAAAGAGLAIGGKELWDRKHRGRSRSSSSSRSRSKSRSRGNIGQKLALGVAGAVAGDLAARQYAKRRGSSSSSSGEDAYDARRARQRRGSEAAYYRDDDYDRPRPSRRKSLGEAALGALGLQDAVHGSSRRRRRGSSSSSSTPDKGEKIQQAALAALAGAATEAWRSRNEPGGYLHGDKGRRILTAAAGAAGVDALVDRDPERHEARNVGKGVVGGLLINRIVNGSRDDDDGGPRRSRSGRHRRSRSRSHSRGGGLKDLAAAGLAAGAAKKLLRDRSRSRSGSRSRRGRTYSESPPRRRRRSKSVGDRLEEGVAALGLGSVVDKVRRRSRSRKRGDSPPASQARASSPIDSDFDLSEEERNHRKLKGKEFLTAGLATIATVHAAHELHDEYAKGKKRHAAVKAGEISPEEAKKQKRMALAKDAASAGLAVLGIKGVYENWKDTTDKRKEIREYERKLAEHRRIAEQRRKGLGRNQSFNRSAPDLRNGDQYGYDDYGNGDRDRGRRGPVYRDGNPYNAMR